MSFRPGAKVPLQLGIEVTWRAPLWSAEAVRFDSMQPRPWKAPSLSFRCRVHHVGFGNDGRFFSVLPQNLNEYLVPPFLAIHGPFSSSVRLAQIACAECATVSRYESDCRICHGISNLKTPGYEQNLPQPTSAPNAPLTTILNAVCPSNS